MLFLPGKMSNQHRISIDEIGIRTDVRPGDLGMITWAHGKFYHEENGYNIGFETYVAEGLAEFYRHYHPINNRMWICEHKGRFVGSICLMSRGRSAQLRYFFILKQYRGLGLGKKLLSLFMAFLNGRYSSAYLWTVKGLPEAAALYTRNGFILSEEKPSALFGPQLIEQRYVWKKEFV